jgi:NTP pyrophosphatase (non-canonical NTP hydrolase)
MTDTQLNELKHEVHKNNKDKGFYDTPKSVEEVLMLIISELGEACEAHRKGRFCKVDLDGVIYQEDFEKYVKDTFEDEIADTVIRILDFCGCKDIEIVLPSGKFLLHENALNQLFLCVVQICMMYVKDETCETSTATPENRFTIGSILSYIYQVASFQEIDLDEHIKLKLEYNKTRPYKHGKKY